MMAGKTLIPFFPRNSSFIFLYFANFHEKGNEISHHVHLYTSTYKIVI